MNNRKPLILSYSGGKDSTALVLYLLKELKLNPFIVFCDTANESPDTYRYIDYISGLVESWGYPPIIKLKSEYTFYSLAKYKQRFPSIKARFCTIMLKIAPPIKWALDQKLENYVVASGIRRDESKQRNERKEWEYSKKIYDQVLWNPLIDWSVEQVFEIHKKYNIDPNPMYKKGFRRVGCFPCVNAGRNELLLMDKFYPERMKEIAQWEKELDSTYFAPRRKGRDGKGKIWKVDRHIMWAKKSSPGLEQLRLSSLFAEKEKFCAYAGLGVCE